MTNFIKWNGTSEDGSDGNKKWKDANLTWGDYQLITEVVEEVVKAGSSPTARKKRLDKFLAQEPEKEKKLIHLICRIDGVKVYDDKKEVQNDVQVTLEKVEMLAEQVLGKKIKVENPDVV
mgnify:CR=1 FL=1|tara:strand:- start:1629 stop:1988 length:360 start_codon:yes stop_codon:yes gene_type:complete